MRGAAYDPCDPDGQPMRCAGSRACPELCTLYRVQCVPAPPVGLCIYWRVCRNNKALNLLVEVIWAPGQFCADWSCLVGHGHPSLKIEFSKFCILMFALPRRNLPPLSLPTPSPGTSARRTAYSRQRTAFYSGYHIYRVPPLNGY